MGKNTSEKLFTVYIHTNKLNNKKYVGATCKKPEHRYQHGLAYKRNKEFYLDIEKYGWDGFLHEIIKNNLPKQEAYLLEIELIKKHNTTNKDFGYNKSKGGEFGRYGAIVSEETRKKIGEGNKGKVVPESAKEKLSKINTGKIYSDETRKKKSIPIVQLNKNMELVGEYFGIKEASRKTNIDRANISSCCNHKKKTAGGYFWMFRKEYFKEGEEE